MKVLKKAKLYWELGNPFKRRIAYIGWAGHENLGDEMLLEAYKRLFAGYHFMPLFHLSPGKKALYERITGRKVFPAGCLGGGTLINRDKGYLREFARLVKECPTRFCLGTGVANPEFWATGQKDWEDDLRAWVELLRQSQFVGVRGPMGANILKEAGLPDVEVVGDSALILARESQHIAAEEKLLGVNVGTSRGNVWGTEDDVLDKLARVCKALRSKGWKILFLCVWPNDMDSITTLTKLIGIHQPEIHLITTDVEHALDVCERCTTFIGMKLHSVVTALCAGVPSIMIEYRPKCRDFMASMGLQRYSFRSDALDVDRLVNLSEWLANNRTTVQNETRKKIVEFKRRLTNGASKIKEMIRNPALTA